MSDRLEFYNGHGGMIAAVDSSIIPPMDSYINIRGVTYKVADITYALDHSDGLVTDRKMRANITLYKVSQLNRGD
jgi:hypothetical protein